MTKGSVTIGSVDFARRGAQSANGKRSPEQRIVLARKAAHARWKGHKKHAKRKPRKGAKKKRR